MNSCSRRGDGNDFGSVEAMRILMRGVPALGSVSGLSSPGSGVPVKSSHSGALQMARWILDGLIQSCPEFELLAIGRRGITSSRGDARSKDELTTLSRARNLAWFDPISPYWWLPAMLRQMVGGRFFFTTMAHGLTEPAQLASLAASLQSSSTASDVVVVPSKVVAASLSDQIDWFAGLMGGKPGCQPRIEVINYGVPPVMEYDRNVARATLGWQLDGQYALCLGRMSATHKFDFEALFEAFAYALARDVELTLVLAGAGTTADQRLIEGLGAKFGVLDHLKLYLCVEEYSKHIMLSACDFVVSPVNSVTESFGLSIVESMLHRKPVVASSWSGIRELVRHGESGFLIDTLWNLDRSERFDPLFTLGLVTSCPECVSIDVLHLAHCMQVLAESPVLAAEMGLNGYLRADREFRLSLTVERIASLLRHQAAEGSQDSLRPESTRGLLHTLRRFASLLTDQEAPFEQCSYSPRPGCVAPKSSDA